MADSINRFKGRNEVQQILESVDTLLIEVDKENDDGRDQQTHDLVPAILNLDLKKANKEDIDLLNDSLVIAINSLESNKSKKTDLIETDDADDLDTAIDLLNEIKAKLNLMNT